MSEKNKICLFPHLGYLSETSRMIAVYRALEAAGARSIMASHGGTYEWVLEPEELESWKANNQELYHSDNESIISFLRRILNRCEVLED